MNSASPQRSTYDRIAHLYDVDMARNMAFDDIGFYRDLCLREGGRVLELGCGNGRILLELIAAGIDSIGVDCSGGMLDALRRKAHERQTSVRIAQMDARHLGLARVFDVVLCPYSLVTYMRGPEDVARLLVEARRVLRPRGLLVVDAFVPRPFTSAEDYATDYRRDFGEGTVTRSKRVVALPDGANRIERRYEVRTAAGELAQLLETGEEIRPWSPDALVAVLGEHGFAAEARWWDYQPAPHGTSPQFFTVAGRLALAPAPVPHPGGISF